MLESRITSKLVGCGSTPRAFGHLLSSVPLGADHEDLLGIAFEPTSLPHGGSGGVFFSSLIVAAKPKANFFDPNLI